MTEDDKTSKEKKSASLFWLLVLIGLVLVVQLGMWYWMTTTIDSEEKQGQFGDMFGAVNTLFSGMAFAGIIYTILLQRNELALQREELSETRKELKRSADAHIKNTAIMDQQLEILKTNAEIEQARYIEEMLPVFVAGGVTSKSVKGSKKTFHRRIENKGKKIRSLRIEAHVPDSNLVINSDNRSFVDSDDFFILSYVQSNYVKGKNQACEHSADIRFWTMDDRRWESMINLSIQEDGKQEIEFAFIRKYIWPHQTSDREELR